MSWLDALLGRSKPVQPDLDALFALPSAAIGLQASTGLSPTGNGAVCIKPAEGADFAAARSQVESLLRLDATSPVRSTEDSFGYLWTTVDADAGRLSDVTAALHAANTTYEGAGFGPSMLCSLVALAGDIDGRRRSVALVYLYKRGTFYPFAPLPGEKRDMALELQVRAAIGDDLTIEPELSRWFPVWGAPGL